MSRCRRTAGLTAWTVVGLLGGAVVVRVDAGLGLDRPVARFGSSQLTWLTAAALLVSWGGLSVAWLLPRLSRFSVEVKRPSVRALLGLGTVSAAVVVPSPVTQQRVAVIDVIAPAVAWSALRRILDTRNVQASARDSRAIPRRFSEEEMVALASVARVAGAPHALVDDPVMELPPVLNALVSAASETEAPNTSHFDDDWRVMVRLMGEPCAENRDGRRAVFSKRRSLELLCWMVLNRDRSTRSAARTAMWDLDVADSTFATIVSEMRRALAQVAGTGMDASPRTYDATLPLGPGVVSDVDLLNHAVVSVRPDGSGIDNVVEMLALVRDLPFAGTAYQWVDLDGSTTRVILSVMRAVDLVIEVAAGTGRVDHMLAATRAGLRVLPGDERLLGLLQSLV